MALVGYGSSDEEDEEVHDEQQEQQQPHSKPDTEATGNDNSGPVEPTTAASQPVQHEQHEQQQLQQPASSSPPPSQDTPATITTTATTDITTGPSLQPAIGPQIGPSAAAPEGPSFPPLEGAEDSSSLPTSTQRLQPPPPQAPGSPYSSHRSTLRSLTLPTVPDLDIPPSPPGSPTAHDDQLTQKFTQFLSLKKQGVHFNNKIGSSAALRNPSLMDKLLGFVDVDRKSAYANTLDKAVWDPEAFPRTSYKEQLRQSQIDIAATRARAKGAPVAFVTASSAGTSGGVSAQRKTRFDA